jgi:peptidoglycan/LPS O-acetylase OafA/YrhL
MAENGSTKISAVAATARGEIKPLTGVRGFAASLVMLYHFSAMSSDSGPAATFIRKGYLWVDLFFVLSGFIMGLSFASKFLNGKSSLRTTYWLFLTHRLARIYPLYLLVTVESALASLRQTEPFPGLESYQCAVIANIAMVQAWAVAPSFEGAAWSISTEWAAYLLFPALLTAALIPRRGVAFAFGMACLAAIVLLAVTPGLHFAGQTRMGLLDIYSSATQAPLIRCLAEFCLGLLAYRWFNAIKDRPGQRQVLVRWSMPLFLAILSVMAFPGADYVVVSLFPLLVVTLALDTGPLSFVFGSRIPVWLGEISYSLYLVHGKFVRVVGWGDRLLRPLGSAAHPISVILTMLLVCGCATVVYQWVERPCRIMVRGVFQRDLRFWQSRRI